MIEFLGFLLACALVYGYVKGQRKPSKRKNDRDAERIARKM